MIGKNGETVKALQVFTGASIQIDQVSEPARIIMSGTPQALQLAASMVMDIINGTFRGFSLLRQLAQSDSRQPGQPPLASQMVYAPGYGLIPATEVIYRNNPRGSQPAVWWYMRLPPAEQPSPIMWQLTWAHPACGCFLAGSVTTW